MSSTFQNKLLNYEVTPPASAWKKIEEALDESELSRNFPSKLYDAEVIPPVSVWNKISHSLDAEPEIKIPERRKIPPFLKYAAAAVIVGLLAIGGIQLINNSGGKQELARQETIPPANNNQPPLTDQNNKITDVALNTGNNNTISDEARNDAALEASKKTFARLDMTAKSRIKKIAAGYYFASNAEENNVSGILPGNEIDPGNISGRYITLITPEGNIIRMSKKLTDMVCCVSGEDENKECKDLIKKWQEKITCSPACHSAGSFVDILGLVNALQEN